MVHQLESDMSSGTEQTHNASGKSHENKAFQYVLPQSLGCIINVETRFGVIHYILFSFGKIENSIKTKD